VIQKTEQKQEIELIGDDLDQDSLTFYITSLPKYGKLIDDDNEITLSANGSYKVQGTLYFTHSSETSSIGRKYDFNLKAYDGYDYSKGKKISLDLGKIPEKLSAFNGNYLADTVLTYKIKINEDIKTTAFEIQPDNNLSINSKGMVIWKLPSPNHKKNLTGNFNAWVIFDTDTANLIRRKVELNYNIDLLPRNQVIRDLEKTYKVKLTEGISIEAGFDTGSLTYSLKTKSGENVDWMQIDSLNGRITLKPTSLNDSGEFTVTAKSKSNNGW
jgi:hypothetical protein